MKRSVLFVLVAVSLAGCITAERFKELALGTTPFAGAIDRAKGLIRIEYKTDPSGEDPAADENGLIKRAEHLCGAALDAELVKLQKDLKWRYANAATFGYPEPVTCTDDVCSHVAFAEYDVTGDYAFADDKLVSVVRVEGGTITDAFRAEGFRYAAGKISQLGTKRCP